jgi:hypothetical protein
MGFRKNRDEKEEESIPVNNFKEAMEVVAEKIFTKNEENNDAVNNFKTATLIEEPIVTEQNTKPEVQYTKRKTGQIIKKRVATKPAIPVGIAGNTVEVQDFKAIIKKKGLQINTVLTQLISQWNQANYNL